MTVSGANASQRDLDLLDAIFAPEIRLVPSCSEKIDEIEQAANDDICLEVKQREKEAVKLAEEGKLDEAIVKFSELILENPNYGSLYNNRGQAYRLKKETAAALNDLNDAIRLSKDPQVLKQAYTQRAIVKKTMGDDIGSKSDYEKGATYGNSFAKHEMVKNNPYAALCNSMMKEVFAKLYSDSNDNNTKQT